MRQRLLRAEPHRPGAPDGPKIGDDHHSIAARTALGHEASTDLPQPVPRKADPKLTFDPDHLVGTGQSSRSKRMRLPALLSFIAIDWAYPSALRKTNAASVISLIILRSIVKHLI